MTRYRLTIEQDETALNPCEWERFKVVSFNRHHIDYSKESFDLELLKEKIANNRAWMLDYFEHGGCEWSLSEAISKFRFDCVSCGGILFYTDEEETVSTPKEIKQQARDFIATYTQWCNGQVFQFKLEKVDMTCCVTCERAFNNDELIESMSGFYDYKDVVDNVLGFLSVGDELIFAGDSDSIPQQLFIDKKVKIIK